LPERLKTVTMPWMRSAGEAEIGEVAVLGSGGMGTALAVLLARRGLGVRLWARDPEVAAHIAEVRRNPRHLNEIELPTEVRPTSRTDEALSGADLIVVAIPSAHLRQTLARFPIETVPHVPVLSVVKGIENGTFARPSRIVVESLGPRPVAVLTGPGHAEELVRDLPASMVVAGSDSGWNRAVQRVLNRDRLRVYTNEDEIGVELAGALKNILGVAAGICEGLGFGDNAKAALLTRGLVEMSRFAAALGGEAGTFYGLAGVGDVITTCYSPFGRNRSVGIRVGRGEALESILASMRDVAEGVPTTRSVHAMATESGIDMPITREVHAILFEGKPPLDALTDLMLRPPKGERP
jgi:glycerol-3-phosphate dehydrogenase (NAD(P)+)